MTDKKYRTVYKLGIALIGSLLLIGGCGGGGSGPSKSSIAYTNTIKAIGTGFEDNDRDDTAMSSNEDILKWDSEHADADDDKDGRQTIDEVDVDFVDNKLDIDIDYDGDNIAATETVILELPDELRNRSGWSMQFASRELGTSDIVGAVAISNRSKENEDDFVTAGYWYRTSTRGQYGAFATGEIEYETKYSRGDFKECDADNTPKCNEVMPEDKERIFPENSAIDATYRGVAAGFFVGDTNEPSSSTDLFTSDIRLTLLGNTIEGTINNFQWGVTSPEAGRPTTLTLEARLESFIAYEEGGSDFDANTPRHTVYYNYFQDEWNNRGFEGMWNGRFYGEYDSDDDDSEPTSVAGTFYGENTDDRQFIGGAFGADE